MHIVGVTSPGHISTNATRLAIAGRGTGARRGWVSRLLFLTTLVIAWGSFGRVAFARELSSAAAVSSGNAPAMSLRTEESRPRRPDAGAPLCDIRCATTFAPAPQVQDEEVFFSVDEEDEQSTALDTYRLVSGRNQQAAGPVEDFCVLTATQVSAAPPGGLLARVGSGRTHRPRGVRGSVERPPRA